MKYKMMMIVALALTLTTRSAFGYLTGTFQGWDKLEELSPDIVIIYTQNQTPPGTTPLIGDAITSDWQVKILSVLKGTNTLNSIRFSTNYELKNHSLYLVFGNYDSIGLLAYEDYRVIPLDNSFPLDSLKGKTLDEQLQILFKAGLEQMNKIIRGGEEQRDRLEQAIRK